jgi:hypothetical protein
LLTELQQIYFSEWLYCFLKYLTSSAMLKQATIQMSTVELIFENENGIVFIFCCKTTIFLYQTQLNAVKTFRSRQVFP